MLFTLLFGDEFLFLTSVNCVRDESCRETIAPTSQKTVSISKMLQLTLHIDALCEHFKQAGNIQSHKCQSKRYIAPL